MSTNSQHDSYAAALSGIPHVDLYVPEDGGHDLRFWMRIPIGPVVDRLLVLDSRLRFDVDHISAEVMHWGRLSAVARRAWTARERQYRVWKAEQELAIRKLAKKEGEKVTEGLIEAKYRTAPDYNAVCSKVEESQETFEAIDAIYRAFKSKVDVLMGEVRRVPDGSLQRLSL